MSDIKLNDNDFKNKQLSISIKSPKNHKLKITPLLEHYSIYTDVYTKSIMRNINLKEKKVELLKKLNKEAESYNIKKITEGLTRGVAKYINENYNMNHKVSNGFVKLWEIYNFDKKILSIDENINTFHMAEAPGQWIHATDYFIYTSLLEKKDTRHINYNWNANALNPYNPKNIERFGTELFKDDYGFIGRYKDRWLYGVDDTGDITQSKNIKWFRNYLHKRYNNSKLGKLKLVTGDAGINKFIDLEFMHKLDIAQIVNVLACSMKGGNCVIKHFLPYMNEHENSINSLALYINIMHLYYSYFEKVTFIKPKTSNPVSAEYYVIGYNFKGISDSDLDKLYEHLDNMKENNVFIKKDDLDKKLVDCFMKFYVMLDNYNNETKAIRVELLKCELESKNKRQMCNKYLNYIYGNNLVSKNVNQWMIDNNML